MTKERLKRTNNIELRGEVISQNLVLVTLEAV
jgi:hypothetical protein